MPVFKLQGLLSFDSNVMYIIDSPTALHDQTASSGGDADDDDGNSKRMLTAISLVSLKYGSKGSRIQDMCVNCRRRQLDIDTY